MRKIYFTLTTLLFVFFFTNIKAEVFRGYIVTKNDKILTGQIGNIWHSESRSEVIFINDFGSIYSLQPELIKGFVFKKDTKFVAYESKFSRKKKWRFLQVLLKGEGMSLYRSPIEKVKQTNNGLFTQTHTYRSNEYWLEVKGRSPIRLNRMGYRKKFKRLISRVAPELAQKIGKKGYRFKDLLKIVEEYNDEYSKTKYSL